MRNPARSGSSPSRVAPGVRLFAWRWARRASFSRCLCCRARSRSRLPAVVFPGPAMVFSFPIGVVLLRSAMNESSVSELIPLPWDLIDGTRLLSERERVSRALGHGLRPR